MQILILLFLPLLAYASETMDNLHIHLFPTKDANEKTDHFAAACKIKHPDGFTTAEECPKDDLVFIEDDPSVFVLALKNGVVVNEGGVVTAEGKILIDTETYLRDQQKLLKPERDISQEDPIFYNGRLVVLSSPGSENWYHWLFQVLPRLSLLAKSKIDYDQIYINNLKYAWQIESLRIVLSNLGIGENKLFLVNGRAVVQAAILIVPSIPYIPSINGVSSFPVWLNEFLYANFLKKSDLFSPKKVYISRAKASMRKISNEPTLIQLLKKNNFEILYLEELPIYHQAHIFHNAEIIIGPHGSGLANLIFCKPGTHIVEIDHALLGEDQRSFYKNFAEYLNCPYHPFYTDVVSEAQLEEDMEVDISAFEAFLLNQFRK